MQTNFFPFGSTILKKRAERGLTQWDLAVAVNYHVRNLQKVEADELEPGVTLAVRMVAFVQHDVGAFFGEMLVVPSLNKDAEAGQAMEVEPADLLTEGQTPRCFFGPLLLQARLRRGISRKTIAERTGYHLRNMARVEKGQQEPGVMKALSMVVAAEADVRGFFDAFGKLLEK
jgi:transcriptional regulator with XRE-family HTH domain